MIVTAEIPVFSFRFLSQSMRGYSSSKRAQLTYGGRSGLELPFTCFNSPSGIGFNFYIGLHVRNWGGFKKRKISRGSFVLSGSICWNQKFSFVVTVAVLFFFIFLTINCKAFNEAYLREKGGFFVFFFLFLFGARPQQIISSSFVFFFWGITLSKHIFDTFVLLSFGLIWSWLLLRFLGPYTWDFLDFIIYPFFGGVANTICGRNGVS